MRVDIDAAAADLWEAAAQGDHAPERWSGALGVDDALAIQLTNLDRKLAAGERLAGWKVGLTSPRARSALGADVRPFGHLLKSGVHDSGEVVSSAALTEGHIEPELCFVFARPVDDAALVADAVGSVHAGFELNEDRPGSARGDLGLAVADNLSQWGIVVGEGTDPRRLDLDGVEVELTCDGEARYRGVSGEVLDDHWSSLARLVEVLGRHSRRIEAGHLVITGAFCRLPISAGQRWQATCGGIGAVSVEFA